MAGRGRGLTLPAWMTNDHQANANEHGIQNGVTISTDGYGNRTAESDDGNSFAPPAPRLLVPPASASTPLPETGKNPIESVPRTHFSIPSNPVVVDNSIGGGQTQNTQHLNLMHASHLYPGQFPRPLAAHSVIHPVGSIPTAPAPSPIVGDPNNNVQCWSEHLSEDGRRYWYNRVSLVSTYDKPFCLKSPEERSIPPCEWKEYSKDGKKYYSNGKESTWTMPEAFREWKEQMDAVEAKTKSKAIPSNQKPRNSTTSHTATSNSSGRHQRSDDNVTTEVQYESREAAVEAFRQLLGDNHISTSAKMKEVMDLCSGDSRWNALKSQGERKQALAEYQTKRLKQEKELQKAKARRHRDSFLMMLAEHTDIDARTRWRQAVELLQHDARFKNVEDQREREELFDDFISELEKKEKDDMRKLRQHAIPKLEEALRDLHESGTLTRKSTWSSSRTTIIDWAAKSAELRILEEVDMRQTFQSFVNALEEEYRKAERKKKEQQQRKLSEAQQQVYRLLMRLAEKGDITVDTRWKDFINTDVIQSSSCYRSLSELFSVDVSNGSSTEVSSIFRDTFDKVKVAVEDMHRADKRVVKDVLAISGLKIEHDSAFETLKSAILKVGGVVEYANLDGSCKYEKDSSLAEEGEEDEEDDVREHTAGREKDHSTAGYTGSNSRQRGDDRTGLRSRVRQLLRRGEGNGMRSVQSIFEEYRDRAVREYEEEVRHLQKAEQRFLILLEDNFYLAEHVGMCWDDAKPMLQKRSAYEALPRSDRKRLFYKYMEGLQEKMELKRKEYVLNRKVEGSDLEHPDTQRKRKLEDSSNIVVDAHLAKVEKRKKRQGEDEAYHE